MKLRGEQLEGTLKRSLASIWLVAIGSNLSAICRYQSCIKFNLALLIVLSIVQESAVHFQFFILSNSYLHRILVHSS